MARRLTHRRRLPQGVVFLTALGVLGSIFTGIAGALPPPKAISELSREADLAAQGEVSRIFPYSQWRSYISRGGLGAEGVALARRLPDGDAGLLRLLRNFPFTPSQVMVDGVDIAEIRIERVFKGEAPGRIFIPFVRYHFPANRGLEGPWAERAYAPGERLHLYLKQNGPFYESVWWNAVQPVK